MKNNLPLSYIEISKGNLVHNIEQFRAVVGKSVKIAGVVKANAYGHGDAEVVKVLNSHVDYFQINSVEELEGIRKVTKKPVLLLGYVGKSDIKRVIELGCILTVFDLHHALLINAVSNKCGKKQKVHIAVDAHLGREGVMPNDIEKFIKELKNLKNLKVEGVYAHFANIEDTNDFTHAQKQIATYESIVRQFQNAGYKDIYTHISATSGVLAYEKWKGVHPIVRIGIGLYGMWPSVDLEKMWKKKISLKPVLKYVTHVAQVKTLPKGHSVGYGLTYIAKKDMQVAVIPQGYSNGLTRTMSNNGEVLIKGKRAPILGRVAMNMFVVDVSGVSGVKPEDEVVILGKQGKEEITAEELAQSMGTINYEVTTHLSPLLPRIVR
jgi:alanine racemase